MENPWKKINSRDIYENPWLKVTEDKVINPNGGKGIYGLIHFKNKAVGIIPVDKDNNTYLVGQYRYALNEYSWEIPMGGCPEKEDVLEAAKRELLEETGIKAKTWKYIMKVHTSNSVTDEKGFVFLAKDLELGEPDFDDTEKITIKKISFEKVYNMVINGEITDCISVAGILKVSGFLKK